MNTQSTPKMFCPECGQTDAGNQCCAEFAYDITPLEAENVDLLADLDRAKNCLDRDDIKGAIDWTIEAIRRLATRGL